MLNGEHFDPLKLAKSFLWAIIAAILALVTGLPPELVIVENATWLSQTVGFIMNSGAGVVMIWFIDRLYLILDAMRKNLPVWFAQYKTKAVIKQA